MRSVMTVGAIGGCLLVLACDGGSGGAAAPGDAAADTALAPDAAADAAQPSTAATLLVPGRARLVGTHLTVCSNQSPAPGDRWCAFALPSRILGRTELWVVNFSRALAGPVPKCDGSDAGCVLVTDNLWTGLPTGGPSHPTTHRFDGDTLIYHANASLGVDPYRGPIFAWRPGWAAGRQISLTSDAYTCSAHGTAEAVVCVENLATDPATPLQFDLTGGPLATGARLVTRIYPTRPNGQSSQWRVAFTGAGDYLAWSTGGSIAAPEILSVAKVTELGMPDKVTTIASNAARWAISAEAKKVFFLRDYDYGAAGEPRGTLVAADFPSGANPTTIVPKTAAFQVLSAGGTDRGVGFFTNVAGGRADYKIIPDVANPTAVVSVVNSIQGLLGVSDDLEYILYFGSIDSNSGTIDARIARTDGSSLTTGGCALAASPTAAQFGSPFAPGSRLVLWADNLDTIDGVAEGWVAGVDCTSKRRFADRLDFWFFAGTAGVVYSDQGVAGHSALEAAPFAGNTLTAPTLLQRQVSRVYGFVDSLHAVLFTLAPPATEGTYFLKLPF
jgi:hypothetical protein